MTIKDVTRRKFIRSAGIIAGACAWQPLRPSIPVGATGLAHSYGGGNTPLKDRAAKKGLLYGSSAQQKEFVEDPPLQTAFIEECNILVPELALKWDHLRPTPETYNFGPVDWLLNFAQQNQMKFRGHTLVWQEALPAWFASYVNPQNVRPLLLDHIAKVVGRYAGKVHSWDVVNEVIWPQDKRSDGLRDSPWLRNVGPDLIELAFRAAAQADPRALLVWNENWLEEESATGDSKRAFLLQHLKDQLSRGVPIHAIGIQAHLIGDHTNIAGAHFKQFLNQITDMGLKILITEMDVRDFRLPNDIGARDKAVAERYYEFLHTVLTQKSAIAVLTWGLTNRYTWTAHNSPRADGAPVRPLPFDEDMNPTPVWDAIARAIDDAPSR
jgi:endo-1,4-beta-xylanase